MKEFARRRNVEKFATRRNVNELATRRNVKGFATRKNVKESTTRRNVKEFAMRRNMKEFTTKCEEKCEGFRNLLIAPHSRLFCSVRMLKSDGSGERRKYEQCKTTTQRILLQKCILLTAGVENEREQCKTR